MNQRTCTKCSNLKDLKDFYTKGSRLDTQCKACKLKNKREKYKTKKTRPVLERPILSPLSSVVVERTCPLCDKTKPLVDFAKRDANTYKNFCNDCWNRDRRRSNPSTISPKILAEVEISESKIDWVVDLFKLLKTSNSIVFNVSSSGIPTGDIELQGIAI